MPYRWFRALEPLRICTGRKAFRADVSLVLTVWCAVLQRLRYEIDPKDVIGAVSVSCC